MNRREFVIAGIAAAALAARSGGARAAERPTAIQQPSFLVPGYRPDRARLGGRPISEIAEFRRNLPTGHDGALTMVTRLDPSGGVRRALMPVRGHQIVVDPQHRIAFFNNIEGREFCTFDPNSLAVDRVLLPHDRGFVGGGHAVYSADGRDLFVLERRRPGPYEGSPARHFGAVSVRDGKTFDLRGAFSCHGIAPHDIALAADGKTLAVANYGSTDWGDLQDGKPPNVIEPSVTLLDAASGKLLQKRIGSPGRYEIRHLVCPPARRMFAIQTRLVREHEERAEISANDVYDADDFVASAFSFTPAPLIALDPAGTKLAVGGLDPRLRQGQSIIYEPDHDEIIVTFASGHALAVLDATTARLRRLIATDEMGLYYPRGVVLLPGGRYAVSGSWRGLFVFERGRHRLCAERTRHVTFFDHSHMTLA